MKYDAITIDTNIVVQNSFRFEDGMLGLLLQFKYGPLKVIISDVVVRETRGRLIKFSIAIMEKLRGSIKDVEKNLMLSDADAGSMGSLLVGYDDGTDAANKRLDGYLKAINAISISADQAEMTNVLDIYFDGLPPFEKSGNKKCEFPDAIALLSIEKWAEDNNKYVIAISDDKGWMEYSKTSKRIDVVPDLGKALAQLQDNSKLAVDIVKGILDGILSGKEPKLGDELKEAIGYEVNNCSIWADGGGRFHLDASKAHLEFESFELAEPINYKFDVLHVTAKEIVARLVH